MYPRGFRLRGVVAAILGASLWIVACQGDGDAVSAAGNTSMDPTGGTAPGTTANLLPPAPVEEPVEIDLIPLRAAVEAAPDDPTARRRLAMALHRSRLRHEAIEHFERAAVLAPTERSILDLALAYGSVSRLDEAEAAYRRILEQQPDHPIVLHNLGNLSIKRGNIEGSLAFYERALQARPVYVLAQFHLAESLRKLDRVQEAYEAYEAVLGTDPTTPQELTAYDDSLYRMASLQMRVGEYRQAGAMLQELVRQNPRHPSAHYALGQALLHAGREEAAQREFDLHMQVLAELRPDAPAAMED